MIDKRILVLTTYPIKNPQHGGQKRTSAIVQAYQANFTAVRHCAIFFKGFYADFGQDDIALSRASEMLIRQSPLTGDIICGDSIYKDPKVKRKLTKLFLSFQPQVIHIEQPFTYLGLKPLLKEINLKPKLIFGSQNIEAPMKREILESAHIPDKDITAAVNTIEAIETELIFDSELVVACTPQDLEVYSHLKAQRLVLAPNGVGEIISSSEASRHWDRIFSSMGVANKVLFVGSAHPPNWIGFLNMVGKGLGFIPHNTKLVLAGSICDYFEREILEDATDIEDATFWLRAYSAGRLSEVRLGSLINQSDVMLLPITEGGGSNLKTAEAILANKKVVTTSHALRSFEWFKDFPNVWLADSKQEFQDSILLALKSEFVNRTPEQDRQAQVIKWSNCLADLIKEVRVL